MLELKRENKELKQTVRDLRNFIDGHAESSVLQERVKALMRENKILVAIKSCLEKK